MTKPKKIKEPYGPKKWGTSVYNANTALIANYINPIIGDVCVQDMNTRTVDMYIQKLQKTKPVEVNGRMVSISIILHVIDTSYRA